MEWTEQGKTAPTLDVFAPTSQLASARTRTLEQAESLAHFGDRRSRATVDSPADEIQPLVLSPRPAPTQSESEEPDQGRFSLVELVSGFPSWLVSLCVHLALILILAVSTFGVAGSRQLELELVDAQADFEMIQTEIELEEISIEVETEVLELEQSELDLASTEPVSLESMETVSNLLQHELPPTELGILLGVDAFAQGADQGDRAAHDSGGQGKKGARFFGTESYGSKFVFVIDCSKSMKGSRWYRAVKELNSAIDGLEDSQDFLVLLYNEGMYVMLGVPQMDAALIQATEANKDLCRRWLRKQRPNGGTFPAKAMRRALELSPDAVFMLSDGELQDNTRRLLQTWNPEQVHADGTFGKIPIHTISLGRKGQGQRMMRSIAHQNDGRFTWIQ